MAQVRCQCGTTLTVQPAVYGKAALCPGCNKVLRFVVTDFDPQIDTPTDFTGRLIVEKGPAEVGAQIFLDGASVISIGKANDRSIPIVSPMVSRHHCTLIPLQGGDWQIQDEGSRNGVIVNGRKVQWQTLSDGDLVKIGDYSLRFGFATDQAAPPDEPAPAPEAPPRPEDFLYDFTEPPPPPQPVVNLPPPPPDPAAPGKRLCPSCHKTYPSKTKVCVSCGIDLQTSRPIVVSQGFDENVLYGNTETVVWFISWLIPFGLYPIASEAYGKFKPHAMYAITAATIAISVAVWCVDRRLGGDLFGPCKNLMMWAGDQPNPMLALAARLQRLPAPREPGEFRYYQLLTNVFLHGGIMHLAGNMVFLIVFGNRVNALLGQWKAVAMYILLAILASGTFLISRMGKPIMPSLGASGAIMGLAGMYFILMPISRVHMVIWYRRGLLFLFTSLTLLLLGHLILGVFLLVYVVARSRFRLLIRIFPVRGLWVLLFYIAFDVWATLQGKNDGTAHWAHLGGFLFGMAAAMILLLTRQVDAHGGDILTWLFGPRAWKLFGTPAQRAGLAA